MRAYLLLLGAIGVVRLLELGHSRAMVTPWLAIARWLARDPAFCWMVPLHIGVMAGSALEVWAAKRPWRPAVGLPMLLVLLAANGLRWWVIRTLALHWNMRVMDSARLGVVSTGPYRWIRHPNYVALFFELEAMPLAHGAWVTALFGGLVHVWTLRQRILAEEAVLHADPAYRAGMAWKPRFIPHFGPHFGPRLFSCTT
jgi:methyltransferase